MLIYWQLDEAKLSLLNTWSDDRFPGLGGRLMFGQVPHVELCPLLSNLEPLVLIPPSWVTQNEPSPSAWE